MTVGLVGLALLGSGCAGYRISRAKDRGDVDYLISVLRDEDLSIRKEAASALVELDSDKDVRFLANALSHDKDWKVRYDAAWALGEMCAKTSKLNYVVDAMHLALRKDPYYFHHYSYKHKLSPEGVPEQTLWKGELCWVLREERTTVYPVREAVKSALEKFAAHEKFEQKGISNELKH